MSVCLSVSTLSPQTYGGENYALRVRRATLKPVSIVRKGIKFVANAREKAFFQRESCSSNSSSSFSSLPLVPSFSFQDR